MSRKGMNNNKKKKTTHKAYKKKLTKIKLIIEMSGYKQIRKLFTLPLHSQFLALCYFNFFLIYQSLGSTFRAPKNGY